MSGPHRFACPGPMCVGVVWRSRDPAPEHCPECDRLVEPIDAPAVVLVACSARKRKSAAPARELYLGDLFERSRRYAESLGGPWFILSAKHGLVAPLDELAPYDRELGVLTLDQQKAWARGVDIALRLAVAGRPGRVVLLAGATYRRYLAPLLEASGFVVEVPLAGLGIGHQKQRLGELVRGEARS